MTSKRELARQRAAERREHDAARHQAFLTKHGLSYIPEDPVDVAFRAEAQVIAELQRAQSAVRKARQTLRDIALEEDGRRMLSSATTMLGQLVDGLQRQIDGVDMDAELNALLDRTD